jgi:hypothetical protein
VAKPILVIYYCIEGIDTHLIVQNLKHILEVSKNILKDEYYVFALPTTKDSYINVFYDKDFDEIEYDKLKEEIFKQINKLKDE